MAAVIGLGLMWATYLITASARDLDFPGFGSMLTWWLVRAVVLVIGAGLGGFALAMILRSTMVTVALLAVYAVVGEALVATLPVSRVASFSPASNVIAWLRDGVRVFDPTVHCPVTSTTCTKTYELTLASGALYLGLLLGAALVVSLLTFRRRDVP
ncbi:MAG: hypothetical protein HZY75_11475 [Nocardioidaceae bacterium]|nr:MAG: hypothetical protein HZY75_11475 [Nocardioidaceae bacterium]